ncbi:MAG: pseudouridine synthase [Chloroflexi bacterium]|nr:MAG: pseudouridine synthase [Chloroflexota bacterium]PIE80849.1 MAG: pseudouridine synthase [Chloroflexota bacterium]
MAAERLQKLMSQAGIASRRESEKIIRAGQVTVNGKIAKIGDKADPETDNIEINGRSLPHPAASPHIYIALNKPKGVISSTEDELNQGRKTVRDLINIPGHLYPVGRLDKQSEGLMLMTNDGKLAHQLTHPRYQHEKTYHIEIEGQIPPESLDRWRTGVMLDGKLTAPAKITLLKTHPAYTKLQIIMREGRKRQIRRIAADLGHPVRKLVRIRIASLQLGDLKPGKWRHLTTNEITALQKGRKQKATGRKKHKQTN